MWQSKQSAGQSKGQRWGGDRQVEELKEAVPTEEEGAEEEAVSTEASSWERIKPEMAWIGMRPCLMAEWDSVNQTNQDCWDCSH